MPYLSQITLPSGTTYDFKDAQARSDIATLQSTVTGAMHYIGVTTTAISDGSSTNPITISGSSVTASSGDVVIYDTKEYVFSSSDSKWHEFGSTGSLKALAFKDSASASYTPAGTISTPTFTGTAKSFSASYSPDGAVNLIELTDEEEGKYNYDGTIVHGLITSISLGESLVATESAAAALSLNSTSSGGASVLTGASLTASTANNTTTVSKASSGTATYTPSGSIQVLKYDVDQSGTGSYNWTDSYTTDPSTSEYLYGFDLPVDGSVSVSTAGTTNKSATVSQASSGDTTYTPAGTVSKPTITVTKTTDTVYSITSVGSAPSCTLPVFSTTVSGENLTLGWSAGSFSAGSVPTRSSKTVLTGATAALDSTPIFTGTGARLVTGNIAVPSSYSASLTFDTLPIKFGFEGDGARLVTGSIPNTTYTLSKTSQYLHATYDKTASVSFYPTTTHTNLFARFDGTSGTATGTFTPEGTISTPTFTGTPATITVS